MYIQFSIMNILTHMWNFAGHQNFCFIQVEAAVEAAKEIGYPVMLRAAYALGGLGSGVAQDEAQLIDICRKVDFESIKFGLSTIISCCSKKRVSLLINFLLSFSRP